jgi:predicted double-glycine peptidase/Tfp pilus assembly protein PilF
LASRFARAGALALLSAAISVASITAAPAIIDVPYLAQPDERLCGGAALAMVLRYWGHADAQAEDFITLIDPDAGGIRVSALTAAANQNGWHGIARDGSSSSLDTIGHELEQGRPVIVLVDAGAAVPHYVVVVGLTADDVIVDDPARAPRRTMTRGAFDRAWRRTSRWMLVVLPPATAATASAAESTTTAPERPPSASSTSRSKTTVASAERRDDGTSACRADVDHGVSLAHAGQGDAAERALRAAIAACPSYGPAWGELAGLRFVQRRYDDAARLADNAIQRAPSDTNAWRVLATSRYLQGDLVRALEAWNHVDEPRTGDVAIQGTVRTDQPVFLDAIGLSPTRVLTADAFMRGLRRLRDVPSISTATLRYQPGQGSADVTASITERPILPSFPIGWGAVGVRALFMKEIKVDVAGLARQGDVWTPSFRWAPNHPRVLFHFALAAPGAVPGNVAADLFWERQSYRAPGDGQPLLREEQRHGGASWSDWATGWLRWQIGAGVDGFETTDYVSVNGNLELRGWRDRLAATAAWQHSSAVGPADGFSTGEITVSARSTAATRAPVWLGHTAIDLVGRAAPLAFWPVAGSSNTRGALLRAHPLFDDGVIVSPVFGRRLWSATAEYQRPVYARREGSVSAAGFVDVARAWDELPGEPDRPLAVDVGAGVRLHGSEAQTMAHVRLDLAIDVRSGHVTASAGYIMPWGTARR